MRNQHTCRDRSTVFASALASLRVADLPPQRHTSKPLPSVPSGQPPAPSLPFPLPMQIIIHRMDGGGDPKGVVQRINSRTAQNPA